MTVYVGTSGWQYRHWRDTFYPKGVAQSRWLEFFVERFQTVELNNSFYHLPKEETFAKWRERTPDDFILAAKMIRYLTHIKKLKEPQEPVARFMKHARHLGPKLGPILIQLPPTLRVDLPALEETLDEFPAGVRVAVEFRHDSWYTEQTRSLLEAKGAAFCLADSPRRTTPVWRTTDWGYLRLHEGRGTPNPCYDEEALDEWARRLAEHWSVEDDVYVFFNNDPGGCAVRDVRVFARATTNAGLAPSRVPDAADIQMSRSD